MPTPSSLPEHAGSSTNGATNGAVHHSNGMSGQQRQSSQGGEQEDELSVRSIIDVVLDNKWLVFGSFLAVLTLAAVYTFMKTPEYQASSLVYIKSQSTPQLGQMLGLGGQQQNVANEVEIMNSRAIAKRVAGKLMEQQYVPGTSQRLTVLKPPEDGTSLRQRDVIDRLRNGYVDIAPTGLEKDLIRATVTSTVPKEANLIADLYAQEYAAYDQSISGRRAQKSRALLEDAVGDFQSGIQEKQSELSSFMEERNVVAPETKAAEVIVRLEELRQERAQAEMRQEANRMRKRELQNELNRIAPGLSERLAANDELFVENYGQRITQLQSSLTEKYVANPGLRENPEQDPEVVEMKEKIASLQEEVDRRAEQIASDAVEGIPGNTVGQERLQTMRADLLNLEIGLEGNQARIDMLDQQIAQFRRQIETLPEEQLTVARLQRSLESDQQIFTELYKKYYDARIAAQAELGKVEVIDEAVVPEKPVAPVIPLNLGLGAVLGLVLGIGLAFMRNVLDDKVHDPETLRKRGYSVLGTIPDMRPVIASDFEGQRRVDVDGRQYDTHLMALLNPLSPLSERYRQLRTHVQFSRPDIDVQAVMVTSSGPGEGKSVTAANLAVAMAQSGRRTLYLDADLRRATGHRMFDLPREPGLVDLLFDAEGDGYERFRTDIDNLYVAPAGSSVPNPAELLGSKKMGALVQRLRGDFDTLVIDTPPTLAVTDPLLVSKHCDVTVLVCSADETEWEDLQRSTGELSKVGTGVAGLVLNRYDAKSGRDGYGYGYGYGDEEQEAHRESEASFGPPVEAA